MKKIVIMLACFALLLIMTIGCGKNTHSSQPTTATADSILETTVETIAAKTDATEEETMATINPLLDDLDDNEYIPKETTKTIPANPEENTQPSEPAEVTSPKEIVPNIDLGTVLPKDEF